MFRMVEGFLILVLGISVAADDRAQDKKPASPEQQYRAVLKQYNDAFQEYAKAYREAYAPQDQQKAVQEKYPWPGKYALRVLELVEKNPEAPFAEQGLIWIMTNEHQLSRFRPWYDHTARYEMIRIMTGGGRRWGVLTKEEQDVRDKAADMLLRDHVAGPRLGLAVEMLGGSQDKKGAALLRAILARNPSKEIRAKAAVGLARQMQARVAGVKQLKDDPRTAKSLEENYGKDYVEELQKTDLASLEAEAEKFYAELTAKYLPDLKPAAVALLCQELFYTNDNQTILRVLYTKGKSDDVRGVACLVLGQVLVHKAEDLVMKDATAAEKMRKESETLLEEAAAKYSDVKTAFDGTVGNKAKNELFDLRHLSVGKPAPEVQGLDQESKSFKLSDYKGKVVLLDFWSEF